MRLRVVERHSVSLDRVFYDVQYKAWHDFFWQTYHVAPEFADAAAIFDRLRRWGFKDRVKPVLVAWI